MGQGQLWGPPTPTLSIWVCRSRVGPQRIRPCLRRLCAGWTGQVAHCGSSPVTLTQREEIKHYEETEHRGARWNSRSQTRRWCLIQGTGQGVAGHDSFPGNGAAGGTPRISRGQRHMGSARPGVATRLGFQADGRSTAMGGGPTPSPDCREGVSAHTADPGRGRMELERFRRAERKRIGITPTSGRGSGNQWRQGATH